MVDLQTLFYTLAIITMTLFIVVLTALLILIIRINAMIQSLRTNTLAKIATAVNKNVEVSSLIGIGLSTFMLRILKRLFKRN